MALLNERGPRDFIQVNKRLGRGLPDRNPAQLHHIFPRAYLRDAGYKQEDVEVALNITFLSAESNNFISDRSPSVYLEDRIQQLTALGQPRDSVIVDLKALFEEHLVNAAAFDALQHDDYEAFLEARGEGVRSRLESLGITMVVARKDDEDLDESAIVDDQTPSGEDAEP